MVALNTSENILETSRASVTVKFACMRCGTCCHEYEFAGENSIKRIPVFPDELSKLEAYAEKYGVKIKFLEDVVFPDTKNKRIIVITYKIVLEGKTRCCPFFIESKGCSVNEIKPLACHAYPLAQKKVDAFTISMELDPYCGFIEKNSDFFKTSTQESLNDSFTCELNDSTRLMQKNQEIILTIKQLTCQEKIWIPEIVTQEEMDRWLQTWDRVYIDDITSTTCD